MNNPLRLLPTLLLVAISPTIASETHEFSIAKTLYSETCATCHYDGSGSPSAPDLIASSFWQDDSPDRLIHIILFGQKGVSKINGKLFNGIMPPMPYLTDEEIATITEYLFHKFAQRKMSVEHTQVARIRQPLPSEEPEATKD